MEKDTQLHKILQKYLPNDSVDYAHELLWKYGIQLHIKKPRVTKFGDYRPPKTGEPHRISINNDLNPFAFLVTFLHETAHLVNYEDNGFRVSPHGKEWKQTFHLVSSPILKAHILPNDVLSALSGYLNNPAASSCSDPVLFRTLKNYDNRPEHLVLLESLPLGAEFSIRESRKFVKGEKIRSRYRCQEMNTGKVYLVHGLMEVEIVL